MNELDKLIANKRIKLLEMREKAMWDEQIKLTGNEKCIPMGITLYIKYVNIKSNNNGKKAD